MRTGFFNFLPQSTPQAPKTIAVGMSGGVDSSVAALLLKEQGHRVIGLFMKNWEEKDENGQCTSVKDYEDVARVCERLDIPYYSVEFVKEYWDQVFTKFLRDYQAGITPNPDILCNREIKFNHFLKHARSLGADYLATGHYCQNFLTPGTDGQSHHVLGRAVDQGKDQTYFVYTLTEKILSQVVFPIGHLQKSEVREIAKKHGLKTYDKKDSTGICFIGERNFRPFLSSYLKPIRGEIRPLDETPVGAHNGAHLFTLGQRQGLGLGGAGEPWFVVKKDIGKNVLYVERGLEHPALYASELWADELSWVGTLPISNSPTPVPFACTAKTRYRQTDTPCEIIFTQDHSRVLVRFTEPQRAMTPGQAVVFYSGDLCIGGGRIAEVGESVYEKTKRATPKSAEATLRN